MTDPWSDQKSTISRQEENSNFDKYTTAAVSSEQELGNSLQFEDNFLPTSVFPTSDLAELKKSPDHKPLPDSENYLRLLERKLKKIQSGPKIVDALSEKRAECLQHLLDDNSARHNDDILQLDEPVSSSDSTIQEIYRQIQPVQALSVGETVHIVEYDQLQEQKNDEDQTTDSAVETEKDKN